MYANNEKELLKKLTRLEEGGPIRQGNERSRQPKNESNDEAERTIGKENGRISSFISISCNRPVDP